MAAETLTPAQTLSAPCTFHRYQTAEATYLVRYTFPGPGGWDPSQEGEVHSVWPTASEAWEAETGALCHLQLLPEEWEVPRREVFEVAAACMEAHPDDVLLDRALAADGWTDPTLSCLWDRVKAALLEGLDCRRATLYIDTFLAMEEAVAWAYSEEEAAIEEEVWAALQ